MQLDTHVKGLLDTLAASGQPKMCNSHRLRRARWPLGSRRWSRGRSRSASSKTDHCRGRNDMEYLWVERFFYGSKEATRRMRKSHRPQRIVTGHRQ